MNGVGWSLQKMSPIRTKKKNGQASDARVQRRALENMLPTLTLTLGRFEHIGGDAFVLLARFVCNGALLAPNHSCRPKKGVPAADSFRLCYRRSCATDIAPRGVEKGWRPGPQCEMSIPIAI